jgi:hypothetical protein
MNNFLFRMVERAVGLSAAITPQPPRELHWPVTERPVEVAHDFAPRHLPVSPKKSQVANSAAALISEADVKESFLQSNRSNTVARPGRKEIAAPALPFVPEESPWPAPLQSDHTNLVSVEAVDQQALHSRVIVPFAHRVLPQSGREPRLHQSNGENARPVSNAQAPTGEIDQEPLVVRVSETEALPDDVDQGPLTETFFTMEGAAKAEARPGASMLSNLERVGAVRSPVSTLAEVRTTFNQPTMESPRPRETVRAIAESARGGETSEPPVEVRIGRVEIRFDSPMNPAPPPGPSRPTGFDKYTALRTYAVRPWPSRRR